MKKISTILLLTSISHFQLLSQEEKEISNQNKFKITYKTQKLSDGDKDEWLVTATAVNENEDALYYGVQTLKEDNGTYISNALSRQIVSAITVRNAKGFLASDEVKIKGEDTKIFTENMANILFKFEAGQIYNFENTFKVRHGDTPVITISHFYTLKMLKDFKIEMSNEMVEGNYKSTCGQNTFSITLSKENGATYILQSINGKLVKWIKNSSTQFIKENDENTTLSFNKTTNKFSYSSSDGVNCEWTKM